MNHQLNDRLLPSESSKGNDTKKDTRNDKYSKDNTTITENLNNDNKSKGSFQQQKRPHHLSN